MDLSTFEQLWDELQAQPSRNVMSLAAFPEPRCFEITVQHPDRPRVVHHVIVFPSAMSGMVVRKWWTHDHDVGIETPLQSNASPEMVLRQIHHLIGVD